MTWAWVFVATALIDVLWTRCVAATADKKALPAASWGTALYVASSLVTLSIVADPLMILPGALGAFVGTYGAVRQWR